LPAVPKADDLDSLGFVVNVKKKQTILHDQHANDVITVVVLRSEVLSKVVF